MMLSQTDLDPVVWSLILMHTVKTSTTQNYLLCTQYDIVVVVEQFTVVTIVEQDSWNLLTLKVGTLIQHEALFIESMYIFYIIVVEMWNRYYYVPYICQYVNKLVKYCKIYSSQLFS